MASRDLDLAREAYLNANVEASRLAHDTHACNEPGHHKLDDHTRAVMYGALGGLVSTSIALSSSAGYGVEPAAIGAIGSVAVATAASVFGVSSYAQLRIYVNFCFGEYDREMWETENHKEGERQEMVEVYESRGLSLEDAKQVVAIISKDNDTFVDIMMVEELGIEWPLPAHYFAPARCALLAAVSFAASGLLPLSPYLATLLPLQNVSGAERTRTVLSSWALAGIGCYLIGAKTGRISRISPRKTGICTALMVVTSSACAYGLARLLRSLVVDETSQ